MSWVATTIAVLSAASTIYGQQQAADAQEEAQENASIRERQRQLAEMSSMRTKQRFEQIAMSQKLQVNALKAKEARATSKAAGASAGITGQLLTDILDSTSREEANYSYSVLRNQQLANINTAIGLENSTQQSKANLLRINQPIAQPDYFGAILSGAQTGISMSAGLKDAGITGAKKPPAGGGGGASFQSSSPFSTPQTSYTPFSAPTSL
jgi:maltooligosyltrehalose synthase